MGTKLVTVAVSPAMACAMSASTLNVVIIVGVRDVTGALLPHPVNSAMMNPINCIWRGVDILIVLLIDSDFQLQW